jgi:hypothetical protein
MINHHRHRIQRPSYPMPADISAATANDWTAEWPALFHDTAVRACRIGDA